MKYLRNNKPLNQQLAKSSQVTVNHSMIEQPYVRLHEVKAKDLVKEKNRKDSERLKIRERMKDY